MAMPALLTNSGAASIKQTCSIPYESFVAAGLRSDQTIVTQVRKDLPRTFPLHPRFAVSANPGQDGSIAVVGADSDSLIGALERVLLALCAWQPQTGYTQGMNFVAASLLLQLGEEEAFWVMTAVIDKLYPKFYDGHLTGTQVENAIIGDLLAERVPGLYRRLQAASIPHELFTTEWIMTLYSKVLPASTTVDVFNFLLRPAAEDGVENLLVRLTIAALSHCEAPFLATVGADPETSTDPTTVLNAIKMIPDALVADLANILSLAVQPNFIDDKVVSATRARKRKEQDIKATRRLRLRELGAVFNHADENGDGKLNLSEFMHLMERVFGESEESGWAAIAEQLFHTADLDGDDQLTRAELAAAMQAMHPIVHKAALLLHSTGVISDAVEMGASEHTGAIAGMFDYFDKDGSGKLDRREMQAMVMQIYYLELASENSWASASEQWQARTLIVAAKAEVETRLIFDRADVDHDDLIDKAEFLDAARCMPCLSIGTALMQQLASTHVTPARATSKSAGSQHMEQLDEAEILLEMLQSTAAASGKTSPQYLAVLSKYMEHCAQIRKSLASTVDGVVSGGQRQTVPLALERKLSQSIREQTMVVKLTGISRVNGSWPLRYIEYEIDVSTADQGQLFWKRYSAIEDLANRVSKLAHNNGHQELCKLDASFPQKELHGMSTEVVEKRKGLLQKYFDLVCSTDEYLNLLSEFFFGDVK